jgi:ribosomal protein L34E
MKRKKKKKKLVCWRCGRVLSKIRRGIPGEVEYLICQGSEGCPEAPQYVKYGDSVKWEKVY